MVLAWDSLAEKGSQSRLLGRYDQVQYSINGGFLCSLPCFCKFHLCLCEREKEGREGKREREKVSQTESSLEVMYVNLSGLEEVC